MGFHKINKNQRWLSLKKLEIGVWKTIESNVQKHQREKPKSNEKLPAKSQRQKIVNGASGSKKHSNLLLKRSSITGISNRVIFLH
jgi:hypothetical protein